MNIPLTIDHQILLLPKRGSDQLECEDAIGILPQQRRYCVADGATEGFDSRRWARLLTKHWVASSRSLVTVEELRPWLSALGGRFHARWAARRLPWYAEEKARGGAFAAFLGLAFFEDEGYFSWQAIALGDSCLMQFRGDGLEFMFPVTDLTGFGYHPFLAPSDESKLDAALDRVTIKMGRANEGDVFLLLTDSIAAWYLDSIQSEPDDVKKLTASIALNDRPYADHLIGQYREKGNLRNDDVAVVRIEICSPKPTEGTG